MSEDLLFIFNCLNLMICCITISLPIGVRCPPFSIKQREEEVDRNTEVDEDSDSAPVVAFSDRYHKSVEGFRQRDDRGKRSAGLGIRGAIFPEDCKLNIYPLGEVNILPNLEEREMKRYRY
jgi:hypothetical protein